MRDGPAHPGVRHPAGDAGGGHARAGRAAGPGHGGEQVRHPRGRARGVPDRLRRLDRHDLPHPARVGRLIRPGAGPRHGQGDRRRDARRRRAPGPGARPRRHPRSPLGPDRGDHRRGPVPGRQHRDRVRAGAPGGRRAGHAEALRRVLRLPRRAQHGAGVHGAEGTRRRHPAAVRDGHQARRRPLGDAVLRRHRRRARERRPRAARRAAARPARFRRPGRIGLLRGLLPRAPARGRRRPGGRRDAGPRRGHRRGAAHRALLRGPAALGRRGRRRRHEGRRPGGRPRAAAEVRARHARPRLVPHPG